jgi:hypothetical protein
VGRNLCILGCRFHPLLRIVDRLLHPVVCCLCGDVLRSVCGDVLLFVCVDALLFVAEIADRASESFSFYA